MNNFFNSNYPEIPHHGHQQIHNQITPFEPHNTQSFNQSGNCIPNCPFSNLMPQGYNPHFFVNFPEDEEWLDDEYSEDPPPIITNPHPQLNITLFKELSGYQNYGNPSGNADILYTGNKGTWSFDFPMNLIPFQFLRAQLLIRGVLDDHRMVPVKDYSAIVRINNVIVFSGRVPLEHGSPPGQKFNNWRTLTLPVPNLGRFNSIVIENTSKTAPTDWMALDWLELRILPH